MKGNKEFDRNVREQLENLEPRFNASSWDKLQERLDSDDAESDWDAQVAQRLGQIERPYNRASWKALAERLDIEDKRLNSIYCAKARELFLMALLLWTTTQFLTFEPQVQHIAQQYHTPPRLDIAGAGTEVPFVVAPLHSTEKPTSSALARAPKYKTASVNDFSATAQNNLATASLHENTATVNTDRNADLLPSAALSELESENAVGENLEAFVLMEAVEPISVFGLNAVEPDDDRNLEQALRLQPVPRKRFVRIGMMGSSDYNRIITPPVRVNTDIVALDQYALGYSGGITVGFESGRWEVETGFLYTAKRYYPLQVLYVEGSLTDGLIGGGIKQNEFDMMQVPLNFRYNFLTRNRWRIYGLLGASVHVVAQSNFYIADIQGFETDTFRPGSNDGGRNGEEEERPKVLETQAIQNQGWLEGGGLLENSSLGINIGAGIERYMSPRWSLFGQPTYHHSILYPNKGLGPLSDRIHTMSLFMGIKVRL